MPNKDIFPQVAVGAVVFNENKVLLVKRSNEPAKDMWAVPGGKILPGETMRDALQREVFEETAIQIEVREPVYIFDVIEKDKSSELLFHYVIIDFEADYISGEIKAGDDALSVGWFSRSDISRLNVNKKTVDLLKDKFQFC